MKAASRCRRMVGAGLLCWLAATVLADLPAHAQQQDSPEAPPPAVVATSVEIRPVSTPATYSGTVEAIDAVDLIARVQGFLETVEFDPGDDVEAGDVLFRIESRPYEASVAAAEARVAQTEAQLNDAEQDLARLETLAERNVAAAAQLEDAQAAELVAQADVAVAEAGLDQARIEHSYTTIEAPFPGQISRNFFSEGALVGPNAGPLARLTRMDPVRVVFSISDTLLTDLRMAAGGGLPDAETLDFELVLSNGAPYPTPGRVEYIASETDAATGTVPVRLIFDNPDRLLIPGQFVDVTIGASEPPEMPVVPQTAVLQDRDGRYVFVVSEDSTVSQRRIEVGDRVGNDWAVEDGLEAGERVVVQGLQRIADGMAVQVSEAPAGAED